MNDRVETFFDNAKRWNDEFRLLREVVLENDFLTEDFKWMHPCYTYHGKNVVLIHGFKEYCALLFHKGVLLKDTDNILIQQTENVQSARQIRFTGLQEIIDLKLTIKAYIFEAMEVEKAGLEVPMKKTSEFKMPDEFKEALDNDPDLKTAFQGLTPGRQRGYLLYFSQAKQSATRANRVKKHIPKILQGKGLNDQ